MTELTRDEMMNIDGGLILTTILIVGGVIAGAVIAEDALDD